MPYSKGPSYILKTGDFPYVRSHCFCWTYRFRRGWSSLVARLRYIVPGVTGKVFFVLTRGEHTLHTSTFDPPPWLGSPPRWNFQAASAYVNAKIIIKLISNVGKAPKPKNPKIGTGRFALNLQRVLQESVLGGPLTFFLLSIYQDHDHLNKDLLFFFRSQKLNKNA